MYGRPFERIVDALEIGIGPEAHRFASHHATTVARERRSGDEQRAELAQPVELRVSPDPQPKGEQMFTMRRAVLSVLAATAVAASLAVAPAATANGPTVDQLTNAGWTCISSAIVPRIVCSSPGLGFPAVPADPAGPPAFSHIIFSLDGTFLGTVHLIRADLYRGQPCGRDGAYFFIEHAGYYRCDHF